MSEREADSAVKKTATALRARVLKSKDGLLVGSEDDLVTELGISRPTLRQAAALLVQEQWLTVRRGVGGGYFARRPDSRAVSHMAAGYLQAHDATVEEIICAVMPIRVELARLSARHLDERTRGQLSAFLESEQARSPEELADYRDFLQSEREFGSVLGIASKNKVLALFYTILYDLAARIRRRDDIYLNHRDRILEYRTLRNRLVSVILDRDEDFAVLTAERASSLVLKWMDDDANASGRTSGARKAAWLG